MTAWIPVSERLPESPCYVLATIDDEEEHRDRFVGAHVIPKLNIDKVDPLLLVGTKVGNLKLIRPYPLCRLL